MSRKSWRLQVAKEVLARAQLQVSTLDLWPPLETLIESISQLGVLTGPAEKLILHESFKSWYIRS
jgi:hypothetical protein